MSDNTSKNPKKVDTWTIVICTSLVTATLTFLGLWWAIHSFSAPTLLQYTGYADSFLIKDPNAKVDLFTLHILGELVMNGTLMSIDDLWSFQSSFYQTIISVLIATNAILAVFAFVFVKFSSHDKAIDAAVEHTQTYINGLEFEKDVRNASEDILTTTKSDYNETITLVSSQMEQLESSNQKYLYEIEYLQKEHKDLKRQLNIIINRIAENDNTEKNGSTLNLRL